MDRQIDKIYKSQMIFFWINIIIIAIGLLIILYFKGPNFASLSSSDVTFERYAIILTLAVIPISLKLFHSNLQKIRLLDQHTFLKKYTIVFYLRIIIFDLTAILNMAGLQLYNSHNTMYLTIMIIFALFFCYPSRKTLKKESEQEPEEEYQQNIN